MVVKEKGNFKSRKSLIALSTVCPYNNLTIKNDPFLATEARTELQELKDLYCDSYKDVHGIKARWVYEQVLTVEDLKEMLARLEQEYRAHKEEADRWEAVAEQKAREQIQALVNYGAKDVAMAIRWMHDAEDTDGDNRFLDFTLGTRYGFIEEVLKNGL